MKKSGLLLCLVLLAVLFPAGPDSAALVSKKATGEQRLLVIMTRFPDVGPTLSPGEMRAKYFDRLNRYIRSVSSGKAWITGKMTDWYTLPDPVDRYRLSQHNLEVEKGRVNKLIEDALNLADPDEDFSRYDMIFLSLGAGLKDYGMMGLCGYPGMLGWQNRLPVRTRGKGQGIPGGLAIFCEPAHLGVVFHDTAHILGGVEGSRRILPCLYDHDLQAKRGPFRGYAQFYLTNVGYFDPMSCHFYGIKNPPPGICAWTRMRLGWLDPGDVAEISRGEERRLVLAPLSAGRPGLKVVRIPVDAHTSYLIENRQPLGPDQYLPSHGVLIYFCDDRVEECRHSKSPVRLINADPSVPELKGAPFGPAGKSSFVDEKRGITVRVLASSGQNCEILISRRP